MEAHVNSLGKGKLMASHGLPAGWVGFGSICDVLCLLPFGGVLAHLEL
jgi:hypothetical protein